MNFFSKALDGISQRTYGTKLSVTYAFKSMLVLSTTLHLQNNQSRVVLIAVQMQIIFEPEESGICNINPVIIISATLTEQYDDLRHTDQGKPKDRVYTEPAPLVNQSS